MIICLYVDDMLIFGTNALVANETKELLSSLSEMKNMGEAGVTLGIRIQKTKMRAFPYSQLHYIERMLKKFSCFNVNPMRTPYVP